MARCLLNYLLVAVVLACPYQCGVLAAVAPEIEEATTCDCCHAQCPAEEPAPSAPVEDSHDCFCHGATCEAPRDTQAEFAPQATLLLAIAADQANLLPCPGEAMIRLVAEEAGSASGWEICLCQCALLL